METAKRHPLTSSTYLPSYLDSPYLSNAKVAGRPYYSDLPYLDNNYAGYTGQYSSYNINRPQSQVWAERIPVPKKYVEYVPEQRVEYVPREREYTDYLEIEHVRDYMPVPRLEKRVEMIPIERYDEKVDYQPVDRSYVKGTVPGADTTGDLGYSRAGYDYGYSRYRPNTSYSGGYSGYYPGYSAEIADRVLTEMWVVEGKHFELRQAIQVECFFE